MTRLNISEQLTDALYEPFRADPEMQGAISEAIESGNARSLFAILRSAIPTAQETFTREEIAYRFDQGEVAFLSWGEVICRTHEVSAVYDRLQKELATSTRAGR